MRVDERRKGVAFGKGKGEREARVSKKKKKKKWQRYDIPFIKGRFLPGYEYEHDRRVERLDINVYIF